MERADTTKIEEYLGTDIVNLIQNKSFPLLYTHLCYEMVKFLDDKGEKKILLINIPIEELSTDVNKMDEYWAELCNFIALILRSSLIREEFQPNQLAYPGAWYKNNDCFLLVGNNDSYYFLTCDRLGDRLRLRFLNPNNQKEALRISEKQTTLSNANSIYRLNAIPAQLQAGLKECMAEIETANINIPSRNVKFNTASLICSPCPPQCNNAGNYILPIVEILNGDAEAPASDIVVMLGDKAFGNIQTLTNRALRGPIKKLIIIGSQHDEYLFNDNCQKVIFTFREIHEYCAPEGLEYYAPKLEEIEFPWLKKALEGLHTLLNEIKNTIGDESANYINNFVSKVFSSIAFSATALEAIKTNHFPQFLDNVFEGNFVDEKKRLVVWMNGLSYNLESNPKRDYALKKKNSVIITQNKSIQKQAKNANSRRIIADAPVQYCNDRRQKEDITTIMRYCSFARVIGLYYENQRRLKDYTERSLKQNPIFGQPQQENDEQNEPTNFNIEDYVIYDDYFKSFIERIYNVNTVEFTDGTKENIVGDVLVKERDSCLCKDFDDIDNPENKTIVFYSQNNEYFSTLFKAHLGLPEDRGIDYYSKLWHDALNEYINEYINDGVSRTTLCEEIGISSAVLDNHLNNRSKFMHKSSMYKILKLLGDNEKIKAEDIEMVKKAKKLYDNESRSFGKDIKKYLLKYKESNGDDQTASNFLSRYGDIAEIAKGFLKEKTIRSVNTVSYGR